MALYEDLPANVQFSLEQRCPNMTTALKNSTPISSAMVAEELDETLRILAPAITGLAAAKVLADEEIQYETETISPAPKFPHPQPPNPALLVSKLISNNYLASSVIKEFEAHLRHLKAGDHGFGLRLSALEQAYYTIRMLVLYNKRGTARDEQRAMNMLEQLPELDLITIWELLVFVIEEASDEERERQGAHKPKSEWTNDDELIHRPATDEWADAVPLVAQVQRERKYGKGNYAPGRSSIS